MLLRASSAPRWMVCSLSTVSHPSDLPDDDTDEAREGTCAAWVAEKAINEKVPVDDMLGQTHDNGWEVDADMIRHLRDYHTLAMSRTKPRAEIYREQDWGSLKVAGTCDLESWEFDPDGTRWYCIDDLKYGYEIVEPTSWQLSVYLYLAYVHSRPVERVRLGIYQPRAMHREGIYRRIELGEAEVNARVQAVKARLDAIFHGGREAGVGDHCVHCVKAGTCEALTDSVYRMLPRIVSREIVVPTDQQLADEYGMILKAAKLVKARSVAIKAEMEGRMDAGRVIPGYAREDKYGKRAFKADAATLTFKTGVDPFEKKLITPAEAERRGADPDVIKQLSYTPRIGHEIVPVTSDFLSQKFKRKP